MNKSIKALLPCPIALIVVLAVPPDGMAQKNPIIIQEPDKTSSIVIKDVLGKPCLEPFPTARPHTINPQVIDHVVSILNHCPRTIKVKLCYYNSDRCNQFDVPGYKRVDSILGTMTNMLSYRYTMSQK